MSDPNEAVDRLLSRNVEGVIDRGHLRAALLSGKTLRVKFGIDPTGANIHIGRAVALWKLREFQDLGHTIVLIIGDMTAQIGDPSDKLERRPMLSKEQVKENLKNYLSQIGLILNIKKAEVRYNSEWLAKLGFWEISELMELFTFQQILERRNFQERFKKHEEISFREALYPVMQGYDSVAVKADVELGGADQLFNLLAGRKIQERYKLAPQDILATKMLVGLDGRKMSTSWGNVIAVADAPNDQFGKVMSVNDALVPEYFEMATGLSDEEVASAQQELKRSKNPKSIKERLAFEIVKRYHGEKAAKEAREHFEKLFSKREMPDDLPALRLKGPKASALDIVMASKVVKSKSDARRLIEQGGFDFNKKTIENPQEMLIIEGGEAVRIGKKAYFKVVS